MSSGGAMSGGSASGGKAGSAGSGGTAATVSPDEFWLGFATALCERYRSCAADDYDDYGDRVRLKAMGSLEDCATLLAGYVTRNSRAKLLNEAVEAGALTLVSARFDECFEAAAYCDYPNGDPLPGHITLWDVTPCREVFEGTVPDGGDCDITEECAGDAVCVRYDADAGASGPCSGTCTPRLGDGESCTSPRQCAGPAGTWPTCTDYECQVWKLGTPVAEGESCTASTSNGPVVPKCEDGTWCTSSVCVPYLLEGACSTDQPALSKCLDDLCTGECSPLTVMNQVGDTCDDETTVCNVFEGLSCDGNECIQNQGSPDDGCNDFYWYERALCTPDALAQEGEYCGANDDCASGICRYPNGCGTTLCSLQ